MRIKKIKKKIKGGNPSSKWKVWKNLIRIQEASSIDVLDILFVVVFCLVLPREEGSRERF